MSKLNSSVLKAKSMQKFSVKIKANSTFLQITSKKILNLNLNGTNTFSVKQNLQNYSTEHTVYRWSVIRGHRVTLGFCNYKVCQNHIYYNENLFRSIELYKKTLILFVFRIIFKKLQLLAKNRFWLPQKQAKK